MRYRVIRDLQGGEFGMGRDYTPQQWQKQALEWCWSDDNDELAECVYNLKEKDIIPFIAELWALEFKKVRKDKKHFSQDNLTDFEDETLEEFYNRRFGNE